jgi:hypothetical protein
MPSPRMCIPKFPYSSVTESSSALKTMPPVSQGTSSFHSHQQIIRTEQRLEGPEKPDRDTQNKKNSKNSPKIDRSDGQRRTHEETARKVRMGKTVAEARRASEVEWKPITSMKRSVKAFETIQI